ncbi:MAG: amidohydrolase family protein [Chloroflexi bacterium]|nr:amidohydrolase family protein [Chloroflexota bacterium]
MPTIDAHHHFWDTTRFTYPWMGDELASIRRPFAPGDLHPLLAANAVEGTVLVQTRHDLDETREFLAIAAAHAFVLGVVGWVDLTGPSVAETIAALRSGPGGDKLVAIRHQVHDEPDAEWLLRADVQRGLRQVAAAGLVYDLLVRTRELPAAIRVTRDIPALRCVLDHLAKPPLVAGDLSNWSALLRELSRSDNVVAAKVSGLVTEADWQHWTVADLQPAVDVALETFGPERLMFGSDWPVCLVAAAYDDVLRTARTLTGALSDVEKDRVFSSTALAAYHLEKGDNAR